MLSLGFTCAVNPYKERYTASRQDLGPSAKSSARVDGVKAHEREIRIKIVCLIAAPAATADR